MPSMRISVWGGSDITKVETVVERTRVAAADGIPEIWFPQTASVDILTALAIAAASVPHIALGSAVVPIQGRHPIPMAQQALTVADAAGPGRFTLGIGVTHKPVSEGWYGIPYAETVELCDEQLQALAPLLSVGRRADVDGRHLRAHIKIGMAGDGPGMVLAALGPKMLELAGRYTDGTVTWMTGVRAVGRDVVPALRDASARAGRGEPRVIVGLPVCVTDDVASARERVGATMSGAMHMRSYQRMVAAEGVSEPVDIALVGDEAAVRARIDELATAGATELLANETGTPEERQRTRRLLASLAAV